MRGAAWRNGLYAALSPRVAALFVLLYCAAHAAVTLASGPALALDDVKLNVLTQSWQAGYLPDNPPLFEWTLIVAQGLFGPTLASFVAVKSLFLIATAAFTFLALRQRGADARTGAAGALILPLIPQISFAYHQTLTHSAALLAAVAFFWFALLRFDRRRKIADFALLGVAIGAGALAKYAFLPAALIALGVALARPLTRRALLRPQFSVTVAVAAFMAAPHLLWLVDAHESVALLLQRRLVGSGDYWSRVGEGLASAVWAIAVFFAPLVLTLFFAGRRSIHGLQPSRDDLLFTAAATACFLIPAAVLLFGISNFQERYALAFLFPGFLWLIAAFAKSADAPRLFLALLAASAALSIATVVMRAVEAAAPGRPFCTNCRQHIPYDYLLGALSGDIGADDTLVAFDDGTAGNLRRLFPKARIVSALHPDYAPPARTGGKCLFIWSTDMSPPPSPSLLEQLDETSFVRAGGSWRRRMNGDPELRSTWWTIAAIDRSAPIRAALCQD